VAVAPTSSSSWRRELLAIELWLHRSSRLGVGQGRSRGVAVGGGLMFVLHRHRLRKAAKRS